MKNLKQRSNISEEPKQDVEKLIQVRCGHRAVVTRLKKIEDLFGHPINDSERLSEREALISALKNIRYSSLGF